MKLSLHSISSFLIAVALLSGAAAAQKSSKTLSVPGTLDDDLREYVAIPALPGYEQQLAAKIRAELARFSPETDNLGNVFFTIGSGSPHKLIVAPIDEPGYVVSGITEDGYLRVQRLPQTAPNGVFDDLYSAQPVRIRTSSGKFVDGVFAGLSVHLQPGRQHPPSTSDLDDLYVDIGASSAAEVRKAGVDVLDPLMLDRTLYHLGGNRMTAPAVGDRFGAAALMDLARKLDSSKVKGTVTIAFVTQQWSGARGLQRLLTKMKADELIYVGRLQPSGPIANTQGLRRAPRSDPGAGVLIGLTGVGESVGGFAGELKDLAEKNKIAYAIDYAAPLLPTAGYAPPPQLPERSIHLGVAVAWPATPAEMISSADLNQLGALLQVYTQGPPPPGGVGSGSGGSASGGDGRGMGVNPPASSFLKPLVETYGVSGHEKPVLDEVKRLLPPWAKPETDAAGNLVLHVAKAPAGSKAPRILVVAHMDEIGFEVRSIAADGRLVAESRGGGTLEFFAGHAALVHTASGDKPALIELPKGWDTADFKWPRGRDVGVRVDVGARSAKEVDALGIKVGDSITIPKKYRQLVATRANGRSFDDRVGCAALISAAWALGPGLKDRNVTFMWSTGEELGLLGAAAAAKRLAEADDVPEFVFAIDTFVSSDSPLESKRFADAEIGKGFVIRAADNSNIVPPELVEKLIKLARANQIPVQYGVTGGGNDGSAFLRYGSIDVAMGWPLRYSHSPGEVVDTRDVDALGRIVAAVSRSW
jgi:putative aminopeptidase FrvX